MEKIMVPITSINFENRIGAEVNIRAERRAGELLIIIEPGRVAAGVIQVIPTEKLTRDAQRLLRG